MASTERETDAIDDLLAGIAGFLGVRLDRERPQYVGLRGMVEATVYELAERTAAAAPPSGGMSVVERASFLYKYASDLWAVNVVEALETEGYVRDEEREAINAWLEEKRAEEKQR